MKSAGDLDNNGTFADGDGKKAKGGRPGGGGGGAAGDGDGGGGGGDGGGGEGDNHYLFKWIVLAQVIVYMEAGAVPALLNDLTTAFELDFEDKGILGGIVYLAISAACPVASFAFSRFSSKRVLLVSLIINNFFVLAFAGVPHGGDWKWVLIMARAGIGATQCFLAVFLPVWVDMFAPPAKLTRWYAVLQASVPVGVMVGYCLGAGAIWAQGQGSDSCGLVACWRFAFVVQAAFLVPLCIGATCVPGRHININTSRDIVSRGQSGSIGGPRASLSFSGPPSTPARAGAVGGAGAGAGGDAVDSNRGGGPASPRGPASPAHRLRGGDPNSAAAGAGSFSSFAEAIGPQDASSWVYEPARTERKQPLRGPGGVVSDIWEVLRRPGFTLIVLALTALFFVVTGIQFWATDFLITVMDGDKYAVMSLFVVTSATAPVAGVGFGGWFIDRCAGGFRGARHRRNALRLVAVLGICANLAAFPATLVPGAGLYFVISMIWLLLFCGGACLPPLTGMFIDVVPAHLKALSSSISQIAFNMLGYFLSPAVSGWCMSLFEDQLPECNGKPPGKCPGAFTWGFRVVLFWSAVALLFMLSSLVHAECALRSATSASAGDGTLDGKGTWHRIDDKIDDEDGDDADGGGAGPGTSSSRNRNDSNARRRLSPGGEESV